MKVKKLTLNDADYPPMLRDIPRPPKELYVLGDLDGLLESRRLAVVGSRHVSPYGKQVTTRLVEEMAGRGVVIISGLALGVDALAHQAALAAKGRTIAVLACGLDKFYPATNARLGQEILDKGGAIISEYPIGTIPFGPNFIARNRLVAGLAEAVLITEAAIKSGTLHTAGFALEQSKTVLAVPGNITSPESAGTNQLIKTGALTVTEAADVFMALKMNEGASKQQSLIGDTPEELIILRLLASGISDSGELLKASTLNASSFNQNLTMLEIAGKIRPLGAGHWSLR